MKQEQHRYVFSLLIQKRENKLKCCLKERIRFHSFSLLKGKKERKKGAHEKKE
jgi:hypothetical protein